MRRMPVATAVELIHVLGKQFPHKAMVDFGTSEDTLIATLLSARTRDEQVIAVYHPLRKRFPRLHDLAEATQAQLERALGSMGLYRSKAKAVRLLAAQLLDQYAGKVPNTMEDLIRLPGVGRKTASCVLWYAFGIPAMAVDTHVFRIAHRLGWVRGKTPEEVERELQLYLPKAIWGEVNRVFVQFGRTICKPGVPRCEICPARDVCPYARARRRGTMSP